MGPFLPHSPIFPWFTPSTLGVDLGFFIGFNNIDAKKCGTNYKTRHNGVIGSRIYPTFDNIRKRTIRKLQHTLMSKYLYYLPKIIVDLCFLL